MSWEKIRLGDVCEFVYGKSLKKENRSKSGTFPVYGSSGVVGYHNEHLAQGPAIVVGRKGSIGSVFYSEQPCWPIDTAYYLQLNETLYPRFLYYQLTTLRLDELDKSAAIPGLSRTDAYDKKIVVPPFPTQQKIAAILDAADNLRRRDKELLAKYDNLLQSIFYHLFGNPVKNEKGWDKVKLESLCKVASSRRVFVEELVEQGVPFYRGTEIGSLSTDPDTVPSLFITQEHYERLKEETGVPQIGDLLLPSICPDGRIYEVTNDKPFYFKDGRVLWIKANGRKINSTYLKLFLKQLFFFSYSKIASGSTFSELKIFELKKLDIALPPISLQNDFAVIAKNLAVQNQNLKQQSQASEALFQTLLQKAFKGELVR